MLSVQTSLYVDAVVIVVVFIAVMIDWKGKRMLLWAMLLSFLAIYCVLVFNRVPTAEAKAMLTPFWSYREAFGDGGIKRLGLAREILMNILVYVPLGLILAAMLERSRHPVLYPVLLGLGLSVLTETIQYFGHLGLMETDDVINNTLGAMMGCLMYAGGRGMKSRWHGRAKG